MLAIIIVGSASFLCWVFPSYFTTSQIAAEEGSRLYGPIELAGRLVYIREGCSTCHSMFVRNLHEETKRYGPYTKDTQDIYDYPHLWGSKRTGPDLTNIGLKYSDFWHKAHLINPRSVLKISTMPAYPWLFESLIDAAEVESLMIAMRDMGVPYTENNIDDVRLYLRGITKGEALVFYLQSLKPK